MGFPLGATTATTATMACWCLLAQSAQIPPLLSRDMEGERRGQNTPTGLPGPGTAKMAQANHAAAAPRAKWGARLGLPC